MYRDGICQVTDTYFTKMVEFFDINYDLLEVEDQADILEEYSKLINYFDPVSPAFSGVCLFFSGFRFSASASCLFFKGTYLLPDSFPFLQLLVKHRFQRSEKQAEQHREGRGV